MSKIVKITNTTHNKLVLCYRMPSEKGERANPVLEVEIGQRALLQEVSFANEDMYDAFVKQNQSLIDNGTIIIGQTNAKEAQKISEANDKVEKDKISAKVDKNNEILTSAVGKSNKNAKVKVAVEKE